MNSITKKIPYNKYEVDTYGAYGYDAIHKSLADWHLLYIMFEKDNIYDFIDPNRIQYDVYNDFEDPKFMASIVLGERFYKGLSSSDRDRVKRLRDKLILNTNYGNNPNISEYISNILCRYDNKRYARIMFIFEQIMLYLLLSGEEVKALKMFKYYNSI